MNGTLASLLVKIGADVTDMVNGMNTGLNAADNFGNKMVQQGQTLARTGRGLTTGVTLPIVGIGVAAIKSAAEYEKTLNTMQAVAGVPAKALKELDQLAIKLGQDTVFSTQEAASAMLELAKGGIEPAQIQAGALANTLDLASAADMDLAESATILSNAMNTFGLSGEESKRVADALAGAANSSSANVDDLAYALSQGGSSAARFGMDVEETAGVLAMLADNGIKGSDAGTLLKSSLRTIIPQTTKAKSAMKELGMDFFDAKGEFIGIEGMAGQLKDTLGHLSTEERETALARIFGADASRLAGKFAMVGAEGLQAYVKGARDSGAASDVAKAKMKGLPGALETLSGSIETAVLQLGRAIAPTVTSIANAITKAVNWFAKLPEPVKQNIAKVAAALALLGPALWIFGKLWSGIGRLIKAFVGLGKAMIGIGKGGVATIRFLGRLPKNIKSSYDSLRLMGMYAKEGFVTGLSKAKTAFGSAMDSIKLAAMYGKDKAIAAFTMLKTGVMTAFTAIGTALRTFSTTVLIPLLTNPVFWGIIAAIAVIFLIVKYWDEIKAALIAVWNAIKAAATAVWNAIVAVAKAIWNGLKLYFTTMFKIYKAIFTTAWNVIKAVVTTVWKVIVAVAKTIWNGIKLYFSTLFTVIKTIFSTAWNAIKSTGEAIWNGIKTVITTVFGAIKAFWDNTWNGMARIFGNVSSTIVDGVAWLVDKILGGFEIMMGAIENVADKMAFAMPESWNKGIRAAADGARDMRDNVDNMFGDVSDRLDSLGEKTKTVTGGMAGSFRSASGTVVSTTGDMISGVMTKVGGATGGAREKGRGLGDSIGEGIYNGITSWASDIINSVASTVGDAIQAGKDKADAHSPSREMMNLGADMVKGLNLGLDRTAVSPRITNAIDRMVASGGSTRVPGVDAVGKREPASVGATGVLRAKLVRIDDDGMLVEFISDVARDAKDDDDGQVENRKSNMKPKGSR